MEGKAIIEFKLPEQQTDFMLATNGEKFALFILELKEQVRGEAKHGKGGAWYEFYDFINAQIKENGIGDLLDSIP
jgi:hypothetical protein